MDGPGKQLTLEREFFEQMTHKLFGGRGGGNKEQNFLPRHSWISRKRKKNTHAAFFFYAFLCGSYLSFSFLFLPTYAFSPVSFSPPSHIFHILATVKVGMEGFFTFPFLINIQRCVSGRSEKGECKA